MRMAEDEKHTPINSEATERLRVRLKEELERDPAEPRPPHPGSQPAIGKIEVTLPGPSPGTPAAAGSATTLALLARTSDVVERTGASRTARCRATCS